MPWRICLDSKYYSQIPFLKCLNCAQLFRHFFDLLNLSDVMLITQNTVYQRIHGPQKSAFTAKSLLHLLATFQLAQKMAKLLGRRQILFKALRIQENP